METQQQSTAMLPSTKAQQEPSQVSSRAMEVMSRYGDAKQITALFSPQRQVEFCDRQNIRRIHFGYAPTIIEFANAYGNKVVVAWLITHIADLERYAGVKTTLSAEQLEETARVVATMAKHLRLTELMQFFFLFKQGRFGRFYGTIDPLVLTSSLADYNDNYRSADIAEIEAEDRKRRNAEMFRNSVTREEYLRLKQSKK